MDACCTGIILALARVPREVAVTISYSGSWKRSNPIVGLELARPSTQPTASTHSRPLLSPTPAAYFLTPIAGAADPSIADGHSDPLLPHSSQTCKCTSGR